MSSSCFGERVGTSVMACAFLLIGARALWAHGDDATRDLDRALACYDRLDYVCAEEGIARFLAQDGLDPPMAIKARHYQALLALAHRDVTSARLALRALLVLDPDYAPQGDLPPLFRSLLSEERGWARQHLGRIEEPTVGASPALSEEGPGAVQEGEAPTTRLGWRPFVRGDAFTVRLFGQDSALWTEGLGGEFGIGAVFHNIYRLEVVGGYSDHLGRTFTLKRLALHSLGVGGWRRLGGERPGMWLGVQAGFTRVALHGNTGTSSYRAFHLRLPMELGIPLRWGLRMGLQLSPSLLVVEDDGQAAFSYLLPLMVGVRWW